MPAQPEKSAYGKPLNAAGGLLSAVGKEAQERSSKIFSLLENSDQFLDTLRVPHVSNLMFEVDGIAFNARHEPNGRVAKLTLWATLGYLPYTVTSAEKRHSLIWIMEGARALPIVKFGLDPQFKIIVKGEYTIPNPPTPTYIFEPLTRFLEECRPFLRLIGEHL